MHRLSRYARKTFSVALKNIPESILALDDSDAMAVESAHGLYSPIIPVFTPRASSLAEHLLKKGYNASPLTYPVVRRPRIRVVIHAVNTEEQIDAFTDELVAWAKSVSSSSKSAGGSKGGESYANLGASAKL